MTEIEPAELKQLLLKSGEQTIFVDKKAKIIAQFLPASDQKQTACDTLRAAGRLFVHSQFFAMLNNLNAKKKMLTCAVTTKTAPDVEDIIAL